MQKYITRPLFRYLAERKRAKEKRLDWKRTQETLRAKLAQMQAMNEETEHRMPAVKAEDVPTNRLLRINSSTLEKLTTKQKPLYCDWHITPPLDDTVRTTDPLARIPKPLFPNPMYVEHQRVLTMFRTEVERFVQHFGYLPVAIRVSQKTARIMWILHFDYYAWRGHTIPLVLDVLSERLTDDQVECLHRQEESGRIPATVHAPTTARQTQRLRLTDLQEQQLQDTHYSHAHTH